MVDRVPDGDLVLRRYSRSHGEWHDEGTGRLSAGSLRFDPWEQAEGRGCSVYNDATLARMDLPRTVIRDDPSDELVGATARAIRELRRQNLPPDGQVTLDVVADPWPDGQVGAAQHQVAHCLIYYPPGATGLKRWQDLLAAKLRPVSYDRNVERER